MEYQWLKTFIVAAETSNFRKASEKLLISQPGVTVHIKLLEEYLGVCLFERTNKRVHLTEAGKMFYTEAIQLTKGFEVSVNRLHAFTEGYTRQWNIAISPLMAETILPYILRSFMNNHPDLEVSIRVEESSSIEDLVCSGEVNIGISALEATRKSIQSIELYKDPLLFIVPTDAYDDETGPVIDPEDYLKDHYLFTHHHPVVWDALLLQLRKKVINMRPMKVTQAYIVKRFIQEGLGTSFLPQSIVKRELIEGRVMSIPFDLFPLPEVKTYLLLKTLGDLEKEFIKKISQYYFG
ncbi:LysR family transcriptional regulator [Psychrobacillus glaciei]|uniref:LysR family transcriptional regulator n=1 Tax=Psychrobacillus glaciei TaxID=2283160 RepID=A0A5J6STP4_9BACI|nr:LysR family transcriptional regulator [Psychrobacillus glaciei]QFG00823.1 LysR family transcriptional regulator [Psychrobacillus glaciei]